MKKILAATAVAVTLLTVSPADAWASHGGGGTSGGGGSTTSTSSGWPSSVAPLPAGTVKVNTSSRAEVLSPVGPAPALSRLDASYLASGFAIGKPVLNVTRVYVGKGLTIHVQLAIVDPGMSYLTLTRV